MNEQEKDTLDRERFEVLQQFEEWLELPMIILGFVWLVLLVVDLVQGLNPLLAALSNVIWGVFIIDFLIRFILAPDKLRYMRQNWLTTIALVLPALRVYRIVRIFRLARALRGARLVRIVTSLNRGMKSLRATTARNGVGYAFALTVIVTLVGAAGLYTFESEVAASGINTYGEALWATLITMTTLGPQNQPQTAEGRVLFLLLALYAFAAFGYVTANLATFFIGREAAAPESELAREATIRNLQEEIAALRAEIRSLAQQRPEA